MRPIDADALQQAMYHEAFETDTPMQRWDGGCWVRYKLFENVLDDQPTINPVRHGGWVAEKESNKITCSECGYEFYNCQFSRPNYCQQCGARMDSVSV